MKRKAFSTGKQYGSQLGDFLRTRRAEIAEKEAGADGDIDATASALMEEFGSCMGSPDDYAAVESGEKDPTAEQADALAAVLAKHGVECTGADLLALDAKEEPAETDEEKAEKESMRAAAAETVGLRATLGAKDGEVTRLTAELTTLREQAKADAPLVVAGKAALEAKRADVLKRAEFRGGKVTDSLRAVVANASGETLDALSASYGLDPMLDPVCKGCGEKALATYQSSVTAKPGEKPKAQALTSREVTPNDRATAARKHQQAQKEAGDPVSYRDALSAVGRMENDKVLALLDG